MSVRPAGLVVGCLLAALAVSSARGDDRTLWKHRFGSFQKIDGDQWRETLKGSGKRYTEKARSDAFIELFDPKGMVAVRLYADRCEGQANPNQPEFKKLYDGAWFKETVAKPPEAVVDKPGERDYWEHRDINYRFVKDDKWLETTRTRTMDWVEKIRTKDYVELFQPQSRQTVRLFADRSETSDNPDKPAFRKFLDGKWGKNPDLPQFTGKAEDRDYWSYKGGHFEQGRNDRWWEHRDDRKDPKEWIVVSRTKDFVELRDVAPRGQQTVVRLLADSCHATMIDGKIKGQKLHEGHWGKEAAPVKPYAATGKAEDRDYWVKDADHHWEKVGEGKWLEVGKDAKHDWTEKAVTAQFVELFDMSRTLTIRLGDDACTLLKGNRPERLFAGKWGRPTAVVANPADDKPLVRAKAQWAESLEKMKFPEGEVAGMLNGQEFNPDVVKYRMSKRELTFAWKKDKNPGLPDLEIVIDVSNFGNSPPPIGVNKIPEGVTIKKAFKDYKNPGYIVRFVARDRITPNKNGLDILSIPDHAYVIEYTGKEGDKLSGRIYLCSGDEKRSFLAGSFEATIEK